MSRSKLACPACGTQFHGSRDVCPFCHEHIHQVGGHRCKECRTYIPTVQQLRDVERSIRERATADDQRDAMRATLLRGLDVAGIMHDLARHVGGR